MANTIALLTNPINCIEQSAAAEVITPGHLCEQTAAGTVQRCTHAGEDVLRCFALEQEEMGKGIADAYAVGDRVKLGMFRRGDGVLAWIASGENINQADFLEAGVTPGCLSILASGVRIAQAVESVNATAGDARIKVIIV